MKPLSILGIILVIIGILVLAFGGFSVTKERVVVDAGPIQAKAKDTEHYPISPYAGYTCVAVGVILVVVGASRKA